MPNNRKAVIRQIWESPGSFATVLVTLLIDLYGINQVDEDESPVHWAPETITKELHADFGVVLPQGNLSKLMAGCRLLTSDSFYKDVTEFVDIAATLSDANHSPGVCVPPDAAECAWAITEALLLAPPEENDSEPFCDDVRAYLAEVVREEGLLRPPDVLAIADHDLATEQRVRMDFSDDPDLFGDIYKAQNEKADDINRYVRNRLEALLQQLAAIPLQHGQAEEVAKKLLRSLPEQRAPSP